MIYIGCDHGGFALKQEIFKYIKEDLALEIEDLGCYHTSSVDYPDYAEKVCKKVVDENARGILICGTGIGMSLAANKIKGIRAACCSDYFSAKYTRLHNDANVICMGGRTTGAGSATEMLDVFLHTEFEGGRHAVRINKIKKLED